VRVFSLGLLRLKLDERSLATDTDYVRGKLAEYGNDLLSLGVDGFRLDASKHINSSDIANILSRLNSKPYITQEVPFGVSSSLTVFWIFVPTSPRALLPQTCTPPTVSFALHVAVNNTDSTHRQCPRIPFRDDR
jgi:glycosidase